MRERERDEEGGYGEKVMYRVQNDGGASRFLYGLPLLVLSVQQLENQGRVKIACGQKFKLHKE